MKNIERLNRNIIEKYKFPESILYDLNIIRHKMTSHNLDIKLIKDLILLDEPYIWRRYLLIKIKYPRDQYMNKMLRYNKSREEIRENLKQNSVRCKEYWIKRGYNEDEAKLKVSEYQDHLSEKSLYKKYGNEYQNIKNKISERLKYTSSKQYFIDKGLTEKEITNYFDKRSNKLENFERRYGIEEGRRRYNNFINSNRDKNSKEYQLQNNFNGDIELYNIHNKQKSIRCKEYWIKRGYSEDEAKLKVSEYQNTFSLDRCIDKYGLDKGLEIFENRQTKFKLSWLNKSREELDEIRNKQKINANRGSYTLDKFEKYPQLLKFNGEVYVAKILNTDKIKVGITRNTFEKRYSRFVRKNVLKLLYRFKTTLYNCVYIETKLGECFKDYKVYTDFSPLESYSINAECIKDKIEEILNERDNNKNKTSF